jgi:hypothetical protein
MPHDFKFHVRVQEVAAPGPYHHHQAGRQAPPGHQDAAGAGRGATFEEIFAEFYAVGAALLGPQGRFDGVNADFDEGRWVCMFCFARIISNIPLKLRSPVLFAHQTSNRLPRP